VLFLPCPELLFYQIVLVEEFRFGELVPLTSSRDRPVLPFFLPHKRSICFSGPKASRAKIFSLNAVTSLGIHALPPLPLIFLSSLRRQKGPRFPLYLLDLNCDCHDSLLFSSGGYCKSGELFWWQFLSCSAGLSLLTSEVSAFFLPRNLAGRFPFIFFAKPAGSCTYAAPHSSQSRTHPTPSFLMGDRVKLALFFFPSVRGAIKLFILLSVLASVSFPSWVFFSLPQHLSR